MVNATALLWTLGTLLLAALAEWLHGRRGRRVARLAFGPRGAARSWVAAAPVLRVAALAGLAWGFVTLLQLEPEANRPVRMPEGGYRHLIIALDVSPSMQLRDAGPARHQTRAQRAGEVLMSLLSRIALDQVRVSVVAFYTGAKPVVVDTYDLEVVKNILNDLPLDYAFAIGKTTLFAGVREAAELAKPWAPASTTLVVASDGDTVPDTGLPDLPRAIGQVLVVGVGDPLTGSYIDGHQSRQDVSTLRQLARRLHGTFHEANERHLPSTQLRTLARVMPLKDVARKGWRDAALAAVAAGALVLALLPLALAAGGAAWQAGGIESRPTAMHLLVRLGLSLPEPAHRWLTRSRSASPNVS